MNQMITKPDSRRRKKNKQKTPHVSSFYTLRITLGLFCEAIPSFSVFHLRV